MFSEWITYCWSWNSFQILPKRDTVKLTFILMHRYQMLEMALKP